MSEQPNYLVHAYAAIGELILTWAELDRRITITTWQGRDPNRTSPFRTGPIEKWFGKRVKDWLQLHRQFCADPNRMQERLLALQELRDDIAHNVLSVAESGSYHLFSIQIQRINRDYDGQFERWMRKWAPIPPKARQHAVPKREDYFFYYKQDIESAIEEIKTLTDAIDTSSREFLLETRTKRV